MSSPRERVVKLTGCWAGKQVSADVDVSSLGACAQPQIGVAETGNKGKVPHARHEVQSLEKNQFGN